MKKALSLTNSAALFLMTAGFAWATDVARTPDRTEPVRVFDGEYLPAALYPAADGLVASPGDTTYFVNPESGDDAHDGKTAGSAWKTLAKVNALKLAPGDRVEIAPGTHVVSLKPAAAGTKEKPVTIVFAPGRHEFRPEQAAKVCYFVTNCADKPLKPMPVGILVKNAAHLRVTGGKDVGIWFGGEARMTQVVTDHSEDIVYEGLDFDMVRPSVSEFRVLEATPDSVVILPVDGSTWEIKNGRFVWTGDLGPAWQMILQADPRSKTVWRQRKDPLTAATATALDGGRVRLDYPKGGNPGMIAGRQLQFRNVGRDVSGAFGWRSKDVVFRDCAFHAVPGMAIVTQFCENQTFDHVRVAPRDGSLRTCPGWADIFHFSNAKGPLIVDSCLFSGSQDDDINVHGIYLRPVEKTAENRVLLRFMHFQTYGFAAFMPGDTAEFLHAATLRGYATATVKAVERRSDKEWLVTFDGPVPEFGKDDIVDNVTWNPEVTIRNCVAEASLARAFLLTTRGKTLVENCLFRGIDRACILVENEAVRMESGPVRDLTIRNNRIIAFAEGGSLPPGKTAAYDKVVWVCPGTKAAGPESWVHAGIRIENNFFGYGGIAAANTKGIIVEGNRFAEKDPPLVFAPSCSDVELKNNRTGVTEHPLR